VVSQLGRRQWLLLEMLFKLELKEILQLCVLGLLCKHRVRQQ
jgi:hypothetical protein